MASHSHILHKYKILYRAYFIMALLKMSKIFNISEDDAALATSSCIFVRRLSAGCRLVSWWWTDSLLCPSFSNDTLEHVGVNRDVSMPHLSV